LNPAGLEESYRAIRARVDAASRAAGREVTLVAVSKKQPLEAIEALYRLGQRDFGENYAQELTEKASALSARGCSGLRWHMIGHVQSNKVKLLAPWVSCVQTVDSPKLARALAALWKGPVFLEVNIDGEASKAGVSPADAPELAREVATVAGLELRGLMCVPSATDSRPAFARLRELGERCRAFTRGELSMGMSGDFELAIAEGATHVRVGTALFGSRPT
jgi:pyridoxal phosphate enzyme (YggS family)